MALFKESIVNKESNHDKKGFAFDCHFCYWRFYF